MDNKSDSNKSYSVKSSPKSNSSPSRQRNAQPTVTIKTNVNESETEDRSTKKNVMRAKDSEEMRQQKVMNKETSKFFNGQPPSNPREVRNIARPIDECGTSAVENIPTRVEATEPKAGDFVKIDGIILQRFRIECKLREGGFGQIFKAFDKVTESEVALKLEPVDDDQPNMEAVVMRKFAKSPYCPRLFAKGVTGKYNYVVMQLLGKNLTDLRRQCQLKPARISLNVCLKLTMECVKALESLHAVGFIHRDVKPSNFVIGGSPQDQTRLYMLDYGLARYYTKRDGTVRPPRPKVGFRGTVRYASLNSHDNAELSRRDDLWSLFYSYFEMLIGELPWIVTNDRQRVAQAKRSHTPESMCQWLPTETKQFVEMTKQLSFEDKPKYKAYVDCLEKCLKRHSERSDENEEQKDQFDWLLTDCRSLRHWNVPEDCEILTN